MQEEELPASLKRENAIFATGEIVTTLGAIQFTINCFRRMKKKSFPPVRKFSVLNAMSGMSCADIDAQLWSFGIPTQIRSLMWVMQGGQPMLSYDFLVPAAQAKQADMILRFNAQGGAYAVLSQQICQKVYNPGTPWGVYAIQRSWDMELAMFIYGAVFGIKKPPKGMGTKKKIVIATIETPKRKRKKA